MTIWTIGHSTRPIEDFLALLQREEIERLSDVRTLPGSRRYPQYNADALARALADVGIDYVHLPALGGRRRARPDSVNTGWRNASFRGYADHMASAEFAEALARLLALGQETRTVIMCAEAVPWRCHRTLIADALVARGVPVAHILGARTQPHRLTPFALVRDGHVSYPRPAEGPDTHPDLFPDAQP